MLVLRLYLGMKRRSLLFLFSGGLILVLAAFVQNKAADTDFENAREIIVMRQIAHQILLKAGDTSSRVLPVDRISATEFQINFETDFSFRPDTLVTIISKVVSSNGLSPNYIVNVKEDSSGKVVFGYAMLGTERNSIIPCLGRDQPVKKYSINIKFHASAWTMTRLLMLLGLLAIVTGILLLFLPRRKKTSITLPENKSDHSAINPRGIAIGQYVFDAAGQVLILGMERIELTSKETKLLDIFTNHFNQIVDRKRLQKEVWEDEGVIVGRSLDMFISKLRKKLAQDPRVKLTNIHGKGYKLEVEA